MKQTIRKLVLDTDTLRVETFAPEDPRTQGPGTVRGHEMDTPTRPQTCPCPSYHCYTWSGAECNTMCVG